MIQEAIKEKIITLFSSEEQEQIEKMVSDNAVEFVSAVVDIDSQAKEATVQELVDSLRAPMQAEGSKVLAEMEMRMAKGEEVISSPEEEAVWQKRLDEEKAALLANAVPAVMEMTKEEIMNELRGLGVKFNQLAKKADLKKLLDDSKQPV